MPDKTLSDKCEFTDKETMENDFGHFCNVPLPFDHTASWEVLVSKQPIFCDNTIQVPVSILVLCLFYLSSIFSSCKRFYSEFIIR